MLWSVQVDNVGPEIIEAELPVTAATIMLRHCQKLVKGENFLFSKLEIKSVTVLKGDKGESMGKILIVKGFRTCGAVQREECGFGGECSSMNEGIANIPHPKCPLPDV